MVKAFNIVLSFQLLCLLILPPFHRYLKGSHFTKDKNVQKDYILQEWKTNKDIFQTHYGGETLLLVRGIRSLLLLGKGKSVFLQKALWSRSKAGIFRETTLVEHSSELCARRRFRRTLRKMAYGLLGQWRNLIPLSSSQGTSVCMPVFIHFQYRSLFKTEYFPYFQS